MQILKPKTNEFLIGTCWCKCINLRILSILMVRSFDNSIISVLVGTGSGKADFRVHKTLFTSRSKFFDRATSNDSQGKDELLVTLLDEDSQTFRLYLNLVYANQLVTRGPEQWPKLCQLYVLAEKLQDTKSKNQIVEGMYSFLNELLLKPWSPSTRSKHYLASGGAGNIAGRFHLRCCRPIVGKARSCYLWLTNRAPSVLLLRIQDFFAREYWHRHQRNKGSLDRRTERHGQCC
jgi:hypothetical protein